MMKSILAITLFSLFSFQTRADLSRFFSEADNFFKKYVNANGVNYEMVKKNFAQIDALYAQIGAVRLTGANNSEKKAFYINAYNLIVIHRISTKYPIASPMDDAGFFDKIKHNVASEQLTLNQLEKEKLLAPYQDARIHFVLVCAAKSCPPLANFAFMPQDLESQLDTRTTQALNNPKWLMVNKSQKTVALSKIFEWYQSDFGGSKEASLNWINQFRSAKIPTNFSVNYYEYDWALNDQ